MEDKLKELYNEDQYDVTVDGLTIYNKKYKVERHFELPTDEDQLLNDVAEFMKFDYQKGQYLYFDGYFEALITPHNFNQFFFENGLILPVPEGTNKESLYYEFGSLSANFALMLENDLDSDFFYSEHNQSIKIWNVLMDKNVKDIKKQHELYIDTCLYLGETAFFDLSRKTGVSTTWLDFSDDDVFDPDFEEVSFEEIKNTELSLDKYDKDLLKYFNRASQMSTSEFKYIAYFQVLECIFDEVYLYETVQDAKSIIDSSWFRASEFDHVNKLIKIIDRYNKDQNDKSKTKLVLEKYFRMNLHDEAFLTANMEVREMLEEIKLIKNDNEFKDLQKLAGIIYDIRCEYTHSNRTFPKKRENVVASDQLETHIEIIKNIAQTIIVNYRRQ